MTHENHPALTLFKELLAMPSPSGREHQMANYIYEKLEGWGLEPEMDGAGNVFVELDGQDSNGPLICYASHMDEIGFMITRIRDDGSLEALRSGGLMVWKHGEGPVEILGDNQKIRGVLSMGSTHVRNPSASVSWENVRILTGLTREQVIEAGIRPGSVGVPAREVCGPFIFGDEEDPLVGAWTFDDRMGCVALLRLLEHFAEGDLRPMYPTVIGFVVQEEVGGHGAKALARLVEPDVFVAVDGAPIPPYTDLKLDGRPALWSRDGRIHYDQELIQIFRRVGSQEGLDIQVAAYNSSASDASMVMEAGLVPRAVCFGHVRENSHGYEVARLSVFDNVYKVLLRFMTETEFI